MNVAILLSPGRHVQVGARYRVVLSCEARYLYVTLEAIASTPHTLLFALPVFPEAHELAPVGFRVHVEGITLSELHFFWMKPSTFHAAAFINQTGLDADLDYTVNKETCEPPLSLLHFSAISLAFLSLLQPDFLFSFSFFFF